LVSIVTADGRTVTGHVLGVTDDAVQLVLSGRKGVAEVEVPFADVARAKVEVEFSPPSAAVLAVLGVAPALEPDADDEIDGEFAGEDELDGEDEPEDEDELADKGKLDDEPAVPAVRASSGSAPKITEEVTG
jgi:ribosome maturation factor RimP